MLKRFFRLRRSSAPLGRMPHRKLMMKRAVAFFALASALTVALAGEPKVVLKDTRQYMTYTAQIDKQQGCAVAVDPDNPKPGDCHEVRAKAPISGEYLVRIGAMCMRDVYSQVKSDTKLEGRPLPSINTQEWTYHCDTEGNRIGNE
jgi:hypothetical protein